MAAAEEDHEEPLKDAEEVLAAYELNGGLPLILKVDPEWGYLYQLHPEGGGHEDEASITLLSDCAYLVLSPAQPKIVFFWIGHKASLKTIAAVSIKALEVRGGGLSTAEQGGGSGGSNSTSISPSTTRREDQGYESAEFHHALYGYYHWVSHSPTHQGHHSPTTSTTTAKRRRRPAGDNLIHHDMPCLYTILARSGGNSSITTAPTDFTSTIRRSSLSLVVQARPLVASEVIGRSDRVMLLTDFGNKRLFLWCGKESSIQLRGCGLEAASYLSQVRRDGAGE